MYLTGQCQHITLKYPLRTSTAPMHANSRQSLCEPGNEAMMSDRVLTMTELESLIITN